MRSNDDSVPEECKSLRIVLFECKRSLVSFYTEIKQNGFIIIIYFHGVDRNNRLVSMISEVNLNAVINLFYYGTI